MLPEIVPSFSFMKLKKVLAVSLVFIIITVFVVAFIKYDPLETEKKQDIYVGVAYCGDSVSEGKLLIDKVKGYTNLFVLQSGSLQRDYASRLVRAEIDLAQQEISCFALRRRAPSTQPLLTVFDYSYPRHNRAR